MREHMHLVQQTFPVHPRPPAGYSDLAWGGPGGKVPYGYVRYRSKVGSSSPRQAAHPTDLGAGPAELRGLVAAATERVRARDGARRLVPVVP